MDFTTAPEPLEASNNGQLSIVYRLENLKLNYELKIFLRECLQGSLISRYTYVAKAEIVRCGAELEKEQYQKVSRQ